MPARLILIKHSQPPATWPGLHEQERGAMPFLAREAFEASIQQLFERPGELVFGSEPADQAHARFDAALNAALRKHADEPLAVVSHGTVIALYVSRRAGVLAFPLWQSLGMPSFVVLERDGQPPAIQNLE